MTATKKTTDKATADKKKPVAKRKAPDKKTVAKRKAPVKKTAEKKVEASKPKAKKSVSTKTKSEKGSKTKIRPGNYIYALGRRKRSSAQTRLYPSGKGEMTVNGKKYDEYFVTIDQRDCLLKPLELTGHNGSVDVDFRIVGGGLTGQAGAARLGVSRALIKMDPELRKVLKKEGFLTRDARKKERKKPGLKKARRAPQWSKR